MGSGTEMSLLKRWDRRNQRMAEWQLHSPGEKHREGGKAAAGVMVCALLLALFRRELPRLIGVASYFVIFGVFVATCLVLEVIRQRRKRLAWEEAQRRAPEKS